MRVQQKNRNTYTKELDPVDEYLVNIVKRFFETDHESIQLNIEDIIVEAVRRAKEEIILNQERFTVTSVNKKTGAVVLTYSDVNAEPQILLKNSAFNKNFGSKRNEVCEGNDPRLSDDRNPIEHAHDGYVRKEEIDSYIVEFLKNRGMTFGVGQVKFTDTNVKVVGGEIEETE